jgi:hypothetical protein
VRAQDAFPNVNPIIPTHYVRLAAKVYKGFAASGQMKLSDKDL